MNATAFPAATCRYCHCTEANACKLPDGDPCSWFTRGRTVCTNPACIRAYYAELDRKQREAAAKARANRKRTPAEVHAQMLEEQRMRRRKYRKGKSVA